jgi:hypothetical protein
MDNGLYLADHRPSPTVIQVSTSGFEVHIARVRYGSDGPTGARVIIVRDGGGFAEREFGDAWMAEIYAQGAADTRKCKIIDHTTETA